MLTLQKAAVAEILRWASQHPGVEVCGLVYRSGAGRDTVLPLRNVHPQPEKYYRTDHQDVRQAFAVMDDEGGELLAWYHSHPGGKPDPSEEDMLGAMNVGAHYLIAYPWIGHDVSTWRLSTWECIAPQVLVESEYEVRA